MIVGSPLATDAGAGVVAVSVAVLLAAGFFLAPEVLAELVMAELVSVAAGDPLLLFSLDLEHRSESPPMSPRSRKKGLRPKVHPLQNQKVILYC